MLRVCVYQPAIFFRLTAFCGVALLTFRIAFAETRRSKTVAILLEVCWKGLGTGTVGLSLF
jgi:hypothetical protein